MCVKELTDCLPALKRLDENPQALLDHLAGIKSRRLGLYFEGLIAFWYSSVSPNFRLLAQNIQVFEIPGDRCSRTLGEVDFIIQEVATHKIIHLEVAVKFYLGTHDLANPYCWFGTNTEDQLGKKLAHLQQHQTQLSRKHAQQMPFPIEQRQCLLKGRLFYPYWSGEEGVKGSRSPKNSTANHLRGVYLFNNGQQENTRLNVLVPLEKNDWLSELTSEDIAEHTIRSTFMQEERARCYAFIGKKSEDKYEELERVFCLPEGFMFPQ